MTMNLVFIIGGIIAATILSVLVDYLLKKLLPENPRLPTIIAVLLFVVILIAFIALPSLLTNTIEYKGKIIDSSSNKPVKAARVKFESLTISSPLVDTDAEGVYIFVVSFTGDKLTGRVRVDADKYKEYDRYITLIPGINIVEDIYLDPIGGTTSPAPTIGKVITPTLGASLDMVLLPKFLGLTLFDQAYQGSQEAATELQNKGELQYLGPTPENTVAGQIEIITTATKQGVDAIMISNNAGDQIVPAAQAALDSGMTVVTWDSSIPSAEGELVYISQVEWDEAGQVMADMALSILGDDGGKFAILSASPDAALQNASITTMAEVLKNDPKYTNLRLLDIVYGNEQFEDSYNQALALVDKYPDMELIMVPTAVGIPAASKAMQDNGLCDRVKVSGLGLPDEMVSYTLNGCAPEFALWSFVDLGYLTYYVTYLLASGQMEAKEGVTFEAGRMGKYTVEKDPIRGKGLRVLMGPWVIYDKNNIEAAVK